jgi:hypothetical protein
MIAIPVKLTTCRPERLSFSARRDVQSTNSARRTDAHGRLGSHWTRFGVSVLDVHLQVLPEFLNIYGLPVELLFSLVGVGVRVSEMTSNEGLVSWCTQVKLIRPYLIVPKIRVGN